MLGLALLVTVLGLVWGGTTPVPTGQLGCDVRVPPNSPADVYEIMVPTINVDDDSEGQYVTQTCFSLLPVYRAEAYRNAGIIPMFFNQSGCRCDWVDGVDQTIGLDAVVPASLQCERIVDQNFSNPIVKEDEVGNWISVFPSENQNNMELRRGGSAFGSRMIANVISRLQGFDFANLEIVARFDSELNSGNQVIFSNLCKDSVELANSNLDDRGFAELTFNPSGRQYNLQFFTGRVATCTASAGAGTQTVQLKYSNGEVTLWVNDLECDIRSLNPIQDTQQLDLERLQFNRDCPMMVGGAVMTDISQNNFGQANPRVQGLNGVFYRFMALRSCGDNPPKMIQDRIAGIVS